MSPDTMLLPEHFSTHRKVVTGLPQLGGNFFESAHRPPGLPSMRIACPLVGTEELNSTSSRTMNLAHANQEIRDRSRSACVGSLSCPCADCVNTRKEFITALRVGQLIAPPRPTEAPPHPPFHRSPIRRLLLAFLARIGLYLWAQFRRDRSRIASTTTQPEFFRPLFSTLLRRKPFSWKR